ncbi:MAG: DUF1634 domain-containing protein [Prevotella sp.]
MALPVNSDKMKEKNNKSQTDMRELIGNTLRIGVVTACTIALISGMYYLIRHGGEMVPDYTVFRKEPASFTSIHGIFGGLTSLAAKDWIQLGVLVLMLTPILRVALSLIDFAHQRDWLYVVITAIVFIVILMNSIVGVG